MNRQHLVRGVLLGLAGAVLLGRPSPAQAEVVREYDIPVDTFVTNPCTGAQVHLIGLKTTITKTDTGTNGSVHITMISQSSGTGTDLSNGTVYNFTSQEHFDTFDSGGAPVETTVIEDLNGISPGPAANFVIHNSTHSTVNANGEVTAQSFNFFSECKGGH